MHNEAPLLPETVPLLLDGLGACELVYVCNGCSDGSAAIVRSLAGPRARVIELDRASKPAAIRAGEAATAVFPRFYLDADVWISGAALTTLVAEMRARRLGADRSRLVADTRAAGRAAAGVTRAWMASPHMRAEGFHSLLGVSAAGRARWGRFPDLINDDDFITSSIAPRATANQPLGPRHHPSAYDLLVMGAGPQALDRGQREMAGCGLAVPRTRRRFASHLHAACHGHLGPTLYFIAARVLAGLAASLPAGGWYRDETSRRRRPDLRTAEARARQRNFP